MWIGNIPLLLQIFTLLKHILISCYFPAMYIISVMAVTASKPKKVEFDQDSKIQASWKRVCQIMCNIETKEETEDALRIG